MSQSNKKDGQIPEKPVPNKKGLKKKPEDDLSEEDKLLKEKLALLVERIGDVDEGLQKNALEQLKGEVRGATTSMTSVPKSLKFLKDHYPTLKEAYTKVAPSQFKKQLADFMSVISMTMGDRDKLESLNYLMEGTLSDYTNWGHEYVLHLSGDIAKEFAERIKKQQKTDDLTAIVDKLVPFLISHNSESYAIDLLLEVDKLEDLTNYVSETNFSRSFLYLLSSVLYSADSDEFTKSLQTAYKIALKHRHYSDALKAAIKLDDIELIKGLFSDCKDRVVLKQMALEVARQRIVIPDLDEELTKIISNSHLNEFYLKLAKDIEVDEPKHPDQIYKSHLEDKRGASQQIDSAKQNLAHTIVNAFVNAGTGKDSLVLKTDPKEGPWIYKVKNEGLIAVTASVGMLFLWDIDGGSKEIGQYLDLKDGYGKLGACIAIGLSNSGVTNECDPAKALLEDQMNQKDEMGRLGAVIGLGLAYAGTARDDLLELLLPILAEANYSMELCALTALSLSLIFIGKCQEDIVTSIIENLQTRDEKQLDQTVSRYFAVALGLLFLGKGEACDATLEIVKTVSHPIKSYIECTVEACAYVGSGNVLKVQKMLHACLEHLEEKDAAHQAVAVIGIALIASSEDIGSEMALRSMHHLLQYGEISIKRAIPLALAALNLSNPKIPIQDLLSKLAHDVDVELSQRAIMALGLIGAGTNNARLAQLLRQLASYYAKDSGTLYCVRIAQGFLHMGKGLISIQPYYSDRFLLSKVGMAGIITLLHSCLDMTNIIGGKYHYMTYYLALSMYPRMFFTVDEHLQNFPQSVRVGQAVDVVGQAGQPKKITGFQTHTSPVLLAYGERAEIATEEYVAVSDTVLENIVILKKNPDYKPDEPKPRKKTSL